jgi:hypothetical protein
MVRGPRAVVKLNQPGIHLRPGRRVESRGGIERALGIRVGINYAV